MNPYIVFAQAIGILGMISQTLSFAFKDVKKLYLLQGLAAGLTIIHYLMIGAYSGMAMNIAAFARSACMSSKHPVAHSRLMLAAILCLIVICSCFTLPNEGLIGLLPISTSLIANIAFWTRNNRTIHLTQLFIISPAWAAYGLLTHSIAGVTNEIITVAIIIYYFIRFHGKHPVKHS